jgi:hypothetical protein
MTAKLIGFPFAGVASNYTGHIIQIQSEQAQDRARARGEYLAQFGAQVFLPGAGATVKLDGMGWTGAGAPRRTDWGLLPSDLDSMGTHTGGDITGATGNQVKRARATGAGEDPDVARARRAADWQSGKAASEALDARRAQLGDCDGRTERAELASMQQDLAELRAARAAIVAQALAEQTEGQRILTLAGGAGFGNGRKLIGLSSGGMAARAARALKYGAGKWRGRGMSPSETSLQEAGADAARAMWFQWQCYSALVGDIWNDTTVHHLAGYGWRAAFQSLTRDQAQGLTGRKVGQDAQGAPVPIESASLEIERESLQAWARDRQGRVFDGGETTADCARRYRRSVIEWFASVLDTKARGRAGAAERARFSVLARLVHGRDIATAARGAGFASGRACLESFRSGKVWLRLRAAISARHSARDARLLAARARAVKLAMDAIKSQRAARAGAGKVDVAQATARCVVLASGAACVQYVPCGFKVVHPAARRLVTVKGIAGAGAVHPMARQWSQATTARGQAVMVARAARAELLRARAQRVRDFDKGTAGLRAGWLR